MKKLSILPFLLAMLTGFGQQNLQNLKFDNARYFYFKDPGQSTVVANVDLLIAGVQLVSTDNRGVERLNDNQRFRNAPGRPFYLLAIPSLFEVGSVGNSAIYKFGRQGGENNVNSAEVKVFRSNATPSNVNVGRFIRPPVKFSIDAGTLFTDPSSGSYNNQTYLRIEASGSNTATIEIDRQPNRGNTFVCIFNEKGDLLAALDPKSSNNSQRQSFTTDNTVYVIPIIGKKTENTNDTERVIFEVGDPKENAMIRIFEE